MLPVRRSLTNTRPSWATANVIGSSSSPGGINSTAVKRVGSGLAAAAPLCASAPGHSAIAQTRPNLRRVIDRSRRAGPDG
jgi:hypothetical protein